jgi:hypothetical protein
MHDWIGPVVLGVIMIIYGVCSIVQREYYSSKYDRYIDLGSYHGYIGIIAVMIGLIFLYTSIKRR